MSDHIYSNHNNKPINAIRPLEDMRKCETGYQSHVMKGEVVLAGTVFFLSSPVEPHSQLITDVPIEVVRGTYLKTL